MNEKPGFRSYLKQFSIVSYTVKDNDTGMMYEEVNAKFHRILWSLMFIAVYGLIAFFLISIIPATQDAVIIAVYIVSAFLLAAVYYVVSIWAVYKASRFKPLGEEQVNNYIQY